jgi:hypothetical protein
MDSLKRLGTGVAGHSTTERKVYGLAGRSESGITRVMCRWDHRRIFDRAGLMRPAPAR